MIQFLLSLSWLQRFPYCFCIPVQNIQFLSLDTHTYIFLSLDLPSSLLHGVLLFLMRWVHFAATLLFLSFIAKIVGEVVWRRRRPRFCACGMDEFTQMIVIMLLYLFIYSISYFLVNRGEYCCVFLRREYFLRYFAGF